MGDVLTDGRSQIPMGIKSSYVFCWHCFKVVIGPSRTAAAGARHVAGERLRFSISSGFPPGGA